MESRLESKGEEQSPRVERGTSHPAKTGDRRSLEQKLGKHYSGPGRAYLELETLWQDSHAGSKDAGAGHP